MFAPSKSLNRKRVGLDVSHWTSQFNDDFEGLDLFNVNADESAAPNFGKTVELTTVAILRQRGISQLYLFGERNFILSSIGKNYYVCEVLLMEESRKAFSWTLYSKSRRAIGWSY